jgi:hypothetical protein
MLALLHRSTSLGFVAARKLASPALVRCLVDDLREFSPHEQDDDITVSKPGAGENSFRKFLPPVRTEGFDAALATRWRKRASRPRAMLEFIFPAAYNMPAWLRV